MIIVYVELMCYCACHHITFKSDNEHMKELDSLCTKQSTSQFVNSRNFVRQNLHHQSLVNVCASDVMTLWVIEMCGLILLLLAYIYTCRFYRYLTGLSRSDGGPHRSIRKQLDVTG